MSQRREAIAGLEGVIQMVETPNARPTVKLLESISGQVREAIELLRVPDSQRKRLEFLLLAIQQSTEIRVHNRNGNELKQARIVDPDLFHWSMAQLHELAIAS
ncbi:hypothetical protein FHY35_004028 [Xanthomonas arboricola]|uniref:Uncharacterized protein n=1 Tax=Xanthomonas arboricola TaxID=56448 RepID=A0AAU9IAE4_9XANT|nr:hypothetical protein [Xanthomonas arboricola]NIJ86978.1 hypothetical protein [Xanthomonas arboricola]CAE6837169.1 hypothetical protein XA1314C_37310 [Xanthomonas arboricola]CAE6837182.1 hypothetical protein XA1314C_37310 [Xanthomonas arboricola]